MVEIAKLHRELVARVLEGNGKAAPELRRAAFDNAGVREPIHTLIEKVANHAHRVTDAGTSPPSTRPKPQRGPNLRDRDDMRTPSGQASRQYTSALDALCQRDR